MRVFLRRVADGAILGAGVGVAAIALVFVRASAMLPDYNSGNSGSGDSSYLYKLAEHYDLAASFGSADCL